MGVATAGLIVSAGVSAYQIARAEKQKADAKKQIADFDRQELVNPYENIQISTKKSDQQTEANLVNVATTVDALQRGGTRAILGGIPRINNQSLILQERISQDLTNQELQRDLQIARGEENIRAIRENREVGALAGLHNQLDTANHTQANAIGSILQTGLGFAEMINSGGSGKEFKLNEGIETASVFDYRKTDISSMFGSGIIR